MRLHSSIQSRILSLLFLLYTLDIIIAILILIPSSELLLHEIVHVMLLNIIAGLMCLKRRQLLPGHQNIQQNDDHHIYIIGVKI